MGGREPHRVDVGGYPSSVWGQIGAGGRVTPLVVDGGRRFNLEKKRNLNFFSFLLSNKKMLVIRLGVVLSFVVLRFFLRCSSSS